mmetsp:Transcript_21111/g.26952  ORF Transcript_21111/g.26952 Transcript_21111/m.26952 type:complete len:318 (+) Transcript_21111:312-1265(+)
MNDSTSEENSQVGEVWSTNANPANNIIAQTPTNNINAIWSPPPRNRDTFNSLSLIEFDPVTALHILHGLLSIGFAFSLTLIHVLYVLYSTGNSFEFTCYAMLRLGLLCHVCLQLGQFPLRCFIYHQVSLVRQQIPLIIGNIGRNSDISLLAEKIRAIELTRAWKINQKFAIMVYVNSIWIFLLLLVDKFIFKENKVSSDNEYYSVIYTCWMLLICLFVRILGTVYWGYSYFSKIVSKGADEEILKRLSSLTYDSKQSNLYTSSCVICLCQYEDGDKLSTLPCNEKHVYHTTCVQYWLKKSRCCPLCMKDIGEKMKYS